MPPGVIYDKKKQIERKKPVTDDDFIPIVSLEPGGKYPQKGYKVIKEKAITKLSEYLDVNNQNQYLEKVVISADEITLRFDIKQGNSKANDDKGNITAKGVGVNILSSTKLTVKYGWKLLLKISSKDIKDGAYIDFYADDNDSYFYNVSNVFCGRVGIDICCEVKKINRLIANGISGLNDPKRNCSMCCLRALASNLKALYNLPQTTKILTTGTLSSAVTSLETKYYKKLQNIFPTYNGKKLTSRSHGDIDSDFLGIQGSNIKTNITTKLIELTEKGSIGAFAIGMGAEYHSTIVIVTKDPVSKLKVGSINVTGTDADPSFIYIEDGGGARYFNKFDFEKNMQVWIYSARKFYRGDKIVLGAIDGDKTKDASLDATAFQLLQLCDCK